MRETGRALRELCGSCDFAASCAVRTRTDGPVLCCDRYRGPDADGDRAPAPPSAGITPNAKRQAEGLCGTCADRERCTRRHVESGVFRCADYR
jgi:hypothetical protein